MHYICEQYNVKFNKSDISQYASGKTEPNQDKLFILSKALNVDVTWLMGYDVPMEKNQVSDATVDEEDKKSNPNSELAKETKMCDLIKEYHGVDTLDAFDLYIQLDSNDRAEIRGEMKHMLKAEKYLIKKEYKNA